MFVRLAGVGAIFTLLAAAVPHVATTAFAADAQGIAASGNGAGAPACSACHGDAGEGRPDAGYPRLSGLDALYLLGQLNDFDDGNRASDVMHPIAKSLRTDEREAMASYYASLSAGPSRRIGGRPPTAVTGVIFIAIGYAFASMT